MMNTINKPDIQATVLMHIIDGDNYEVIDVGFNKEEFSSLMEKYALLVSSKQDASAIRDKLTYIDNLRDMACEDLYENGEVSTSIYQELWERDKIERFYCINVDLFYTTTVDYFGEVDVDGDYNYEEVTEIAKEWSKLDLLQKETILYPIDYEITKKCYTITDVCEVHDNESIATGLYYTISCENFSDQLLDTNQVDMEDHERWFMKDGGGKFFTTPEAAHGAYVNSEEHKNEPDQEK